MFKYLIATLFTLSLFSQTIKVAQWNVENLFDMKRDGTEYKEYIPNHHNWTKEIFRKKLEHTAQVICDLNADVIGLEEIENDNALAKLQKLLKRVGCSYRYRAITTTKDVPIQVALLSRIKISKKREIPITHFGRQRHILEVDLATNPPLKIFVNHWRSKRAPESKRVLYAKALKKRLMKLSKGVEYILIGDFNSNWQEYKTIDAKHNDTNSKTGINQILATTLNNKMVSYNYIHSHQDRFIHYTLWLELPNSKRWSYNFFGKKEGIDAIIIPPSLANGRGWEYKKGSFGVYRPSYLFGKYGEINRWRYRYGKHIGKGFSDHLPLYATFTTDITKQEDIQKKEKDSTHKLIKKRILSQYPSISIKSLLNMTHSLKSPRLLKDVVVVLKRDKTAIIQESPNEPAIMIYGLAKALQEGRRYDLAILKLKHYYGISEIGDFEIIKDRGEVNLSPYIVDFKPSMLDNPIYRYRVVKSIKGVYRHYRLIVDGVPIKLYFKNRKWRVKRGDRVFIKKAEIGYYRGKSELIIWSYKDFKKEKN